MRKLLRNPKLAIGGVVFLLVVAGSGFAFPLAPYDPLAQNVADALQAPSLAHLAGTDVYGRDVFSRVLYGGRPTLLIAFGTVVIAGAAGILIGLLSALLSPRLDDLVMRVTEFGLVLPPLLLAIAVVAILGTSPVNVVITLAIVFTPIFARVARASALTERSLPYVEAATMGGESKFRIAFQQVLPNITGPLVVQALLVFTYAILAEASLSFLGLGTQPPLPSWGRMLSESSTYLNFAPWLSIAPGLAILLAVVSLNLLGDALSEELDPRQRRTVQVGR